MKQIIFSRFLALSASAAATALICSAQISLSPVAYNDMPAPDLDGGAKFQFLYPFGAAAINANGSIIFTMDGQALWAESPNSLRIVGNAGAIAPGTGGEAHFQTLGAKSPGAINPDGRVAFSASLQNADTNISNDQGIPIGAQAGFKHQFLESPSRHRRGHRQYCDSDRYRNHRFSYTILSSASSLSTGALSSSRQQMGPSIVDSR